MNCKHIVDRKKLSERKQMIGAVIMIYTGWQSELLGRYQYITLTLNPEN